MVLGFLIGVPAIASCAAFFIRNHGRRRALWLITSAIHFMFTVSTWFTAPSPVLGGWLALDAVGRLILNIVSGVFLAVSLYSIVYLRREAQNDSAEEWEEAGLVNAPEAIFTGCVLAAMATMTMISLSHHLGLLWVAMEGTTLATAPLLYFHKHSRSLEATWKYLLICSVGIALALLGNFFLIVAANDNGHGSIPLVLSDLVRNAHILNVPWLKAAFLFLLVGYGTKMGLAPMHTWLPDAHSEAPSPVSALLSGVQLNCAFLGILRIQQVMVAADLGSFCQGPLLALGIISMAVAGIFILGQEDFKRMLAYSSVEHMGVLAFALGLGGLGAFGCLLHMLNNALAKSMMFLLAENIRGTYRSKSTWVIKGISHVLPVSGFLWIAGFLALVGFPPFGLFLSEFTILKAALYQHHGILAAAFLALLSLCFVGMATITLRMALGKADPEISGAPRKEAWLSILPPIMLFAPLLLFGLYLPPGLRHLLQAAAESLGGKG